MPTKRCYSGVGMRHQCAERIGVTNGWQYAKSGSQVGRCGHLLVWLISFHALKSAQMADLVLEYDNYYGQQCAEAIGARLNYPAFMNIISSPVRMPHRDRTSHWITWILPNIILYQYTVERRDVLNPYTAERRDVSENTPPETQEISQGRGFCTPRPCLLYTSPSPRD